MSSWLLKLSAFSSTLNLGFTPFSDIIARLFGYLTILLFCASVVLSIYNNHKIVLNKTVLCFLVSIIISFVTSLHSMSVNSISDLFDNILSVICFIVFYSALSTGVQDCSNFALEDVFVLKNLLCAIVIIFAFGPFDFKYTIVNKYGNTIFTLGLGNPNGVSLCVMFAIVLSMIQFLNVSKIYIKILNIFMIVAMFYVLYLLSSRTVFFSALFIAIAFLLRFPRVFKWLSYIVVVAPIFVLILQLKLGEMNNVKAQVLGKSINTGRPDLYLDVLKDIMNSPIKIFFGDLCSYYFGNMHNGILTIFATLGVVGVLIYIGFWHKQLKLLRKVCVKKVQKIAFVAILAILIHASSESMGIVGTIPYSIFVVIIMKIAKGDIRSKYDRITTNRI